MFLHKYHLYVTQDTRELADAPIPAMAPHSQGCGFPLIDDHRGMVAGDIGAYQILRFCSNLEILFSTSLPVLPKLSRAYPGLTAECSSQVIRMIETDLKPYVKHFQISVALKRPSVSHFFQSLLCSICG